MSRVCWLGTFSNLDRHNALGHNALGQLSLLQMALEAESDDASAPAGCFEAEPVWVQDLRLALDRLCRAPSGFAG